jgi:Mn-dependent DtxR family transcriptional regulator
MAGRPKKGDSVDDEDILRFMHTDRRPIVGTGDVADEFEFSTQNATQRLEKLVSRGLVHHDKASGINIWWLSQEGRDKVSG